MIPVSWILLVIHITLGLLSSGHALLFKRDPRSALGWIAVCLLFPFIGPVLYFVFGINRVHTRARALQHKKPSRFAPRNGRPESAHAAVTGAPDIPVQYSELARISNAVTGVPLVGGNLVEPLFNGEQAYPAMQTAIGAAGKRIYLSSYIFQTDHIGRNFCNALADARQRGVEVRVIIDGVGEWYSIPRISTRLRKAGIRCARFLPPRLLPPSLLVNMRNHRKLLIVDGSVGFTGGMNIADRHLVENKNNRNPTTDMHFRLTGPIVTQLEQAFLDDWHFITGESGPAPVDVAAETGAGNVLCRAILDGPDENLDKLAMVMVSSISSARNSIAIMTPYFLPSRDFVGALQSAALRGVDIKLILPEKSNQPVVHWATRNMLWELLKWDIQVYYQPPPFAHTKLFLVDGHYVHIGSANIDSRSLRLNFELAVEIYSRELGAKLDRHFQQVLQRSKQITLQEVDNRPLPARIRDAFCWLFTPYL